MRESWDDFFLGMAEFASKRSKDPSTKVGAIIVEPNTNILISMGYNGFPRNIADLPERLEDRKIKYRYIIHGDVNAILNAYRSVVGYTMYVWPFSPCSDCAKIIVQSGIKRVVTKKATSEFIERWKDSLSLTRELFTEAGVEFIERD